MVMLLPYHPKNGISGFFRFFGRLYMSVLYLPTAWLKIMVISVTLQLSCFFFKKRGFSSIFTREDLEDPRRLLYFNCGRRYLST